MRLLQDVVAPLLQLRRILRNAHIQRLPLPHQVDESLHRLLDGCHPIVAVAVEDIKILQPRPPQALVARGNQVLPAAVAPIHPRPHLMPRLRRDEQLIPVACQLILQNPAEVRLSRPGHRPIVVRQVEVADARIERPHHHLCGHRKVIHTAKIVPQAEAQHRELHA